jgi:DNA topoisomerase-3
MVVLLEREIQNFKSKPFWTVNADTDKKFNAKYFNEDLPNNQFTNIDDAKNLIKNVGTGKAKVVKASISKRQEKAPRLFNLSDLQIEMNRRYKMSAQTVLDSCQRLYETYGLTTYPRTDENHISQELAETVNSIIKALPSIFKKQKDEIIKNKYKINSSCVAKKEIGAHEALTPTTKNADSVIDDLNDTDLKVYQAITERFLINFYPNAVFNVQEIEIERNKAHFKAKFESINDKGYYNGLLKEKEFTEQEFVDVDEGDYINITKLNLEEGKTNPPSRFTEGTLIKTMANPLKYVEDAHDKEVLKETKGLGTEATRASVIEGLKVRKYIEVDKKGVITPTDLGMQTIDNAPNLMKSIPLTVMMEDSLALISVGKKDLDEYKQEVYELCDKIIEEIKKSENIKAEEKGDGKMAKNEICKCPNCGGSIVEGKYGFGCSDWKNCKVLIKFDAYKRFGVEKITKTLAKQLLTKGQTKDKQECYSASKGTNYDAYLTYEFKENEQYPNSTGIKFK